MDGSSLLFELALTTPGSGRAHGMSGVRASQTREPSTSMKRLCLYVACEGLPRDGGENQFLIFQDFVESGLVLLDDALVRQDGLLIFHDGSLIGQDGFLVFHEGGLIGQDCFLVG
jgi:hypothetical protein